ncbi:ubiquitin carboxyl-terminal hydrolase 47-like [Dugong dugon]
MRDGEGESLALLSPSGSCAPACRLHPRALLTSSGPPGPQYPGPQPSVYGRPLETESRRLASAAAGWLVSKEESMESPGDGLARCLLPDHGLLCGLGTWGRRLLILSIPLIALISVSCSFRRRRGRSARVQHQEAWGAGQEEASRESPRPLEAPNPAPLAPSVCTPAAGHEPSLRERAPTGLVNQGATCYLNSVLQCLFFTPEFRKAVLELELPAAQPALCRDQGESSLVTQLQRLFLDLQDAQAPATTSAITRCLGLRNVYEQQDVLECFQTLLTRMAMEKVELRQPFQMLTERIIQCQVCKDETRLEEARLFLMVTVLPGPEESMCSVDKVVQALFQKEQVTGDNQYFCETCDRKEDASSELCLRALPSVLVIFLERFTFYHGAFWKLKNKVTVSEKLILPSPVRPHPLDLTLLFRLVTFLARALGASIRPQAEGRELAWHPLCLCGCQLL